MAELGRRRLLLLACLAFQLGLAVAGVALWRAGDGPAMARFERLDTGVPAGVPLTIESGLRGAEKRARAWSPSAHLFAATMQVDWPTEPAAAAAHELPSSGWIIYTFAADDSKRGPATLSMMVDRVSGVVIDQRTMRWSHLPTRRLEIATYPISSTVALYATELGAGGLYRSACPRFRYLSRVSGVPAMDGGRPEWVVTYEDQRAPSNPGVLARIDALDGTVTRVVEPAEGERACDGGD